MGLLGGIARTAVVAGTATAVSNRVSRRQYNRWAAQGQYVQDPYAAPPQQVAPAAAPAPTAGEDRYARLKELGELKAQGVLTEQEFQTEKARVLNS
jgi:hypothetical protein